MFQQHSSAADVIASNASLTAAVRGTAPSAFEPSTTIYPVTEQIGLGLPGHGLVSPVEHLNAVREQAAELQKQGVTLFMLTRDVPDKDSRFTRLMYLDQPTAIFLMVREGVAIFAVSAADLRAAQRPGRRTQQKPGANPFAVA